MRSSCTAMKTQHRQKLFFWMWHPLKKNPKQTKQKVKQTNQKQHVSWHNSSKKKELEISVNFSGGRPRNEIPLMSYKPHPCSLLHPHPPSFILWAALVLPAARTGTSARLAASSHSSRDLCWPSWPGNGRWSAGRGSLPPGTLFPGGFIHSLSKHSVSRYCVPYNTVVVVVKIKQRTEQM